MSPNPQKLPDPIKPKRSVKPSEEDPEGGVVENPGLVKLKEANWWRPVKYVTYLWLLIDKDDLRVGIETQATLHTAVRTDQVQVGGSTEARQKRRYGHPTLSRAATIDTEGNPIGTWKKIDGAWKQVYGMTPKYTEDKLKAVAGGELLYYHTDYSRKAAQAPDFGVSRVPRDKKGNRLENSIGRWIITTNSGRYGRTEETSPAVMPVVRDLFEKYVQLRVVIDYKFKDHLK